MTPYDTIIVGAGPAGLTAATYLARFRRRVLVLDGGPSRAAWIPESHNTPGFPQGVSGEALLARLRAQAVEFGAEIRPGLALNLTPDDDLFTVTGADFRAQARTVLLATGVVDRIPPLPGIETAIRDSRVRMCPICDAYEAIDRSLAVLADGPLGVRELTFLRTYTDDVALLSVASIDSSSEADMALPIAFDDLSFTADGVRLRRSGAAERRFDHLYLALGCAPQAALAVGCGAAQDDTGALLVNRHQMTSLVGLYAAGDVVRGLNQITVAAGEAAIAATDIHNWLQACESGAPPE
ncbi:MAG TPA: NAD(P)/FAD-dependent oxidoreductase [Phenylobacterium sp.]|uniref:NAD(P)/FAD-dependent oxidoreductase n=1 Tax=Phenylobacterium sp. TaxID=1871053 RepID=UPI002D732BC0|nr:NAD(P)/FAD-dependent oxidoreductase [Phenylobacterium sp.]HZZ66947.1 NAD(P)/FAD-dependent oxidoreductase [Phenylobacterium sp.]